MTAQEILAIIEAAEESTYIEVCALLMRPSSIPTSLCISALQELGHDDLMAAIRALLPDEYTIV
jgi:hypothetical protein